VSIDLATLTVRAGDRLVEARMPAAARDAFVTGHWDATGLLLDDYDQVEAVARRLPYVAGF
jgi:3-isopropylmalate/(R)-2-methylmalate dehydratase small subunit